MNKWIEVRHIFFQVKCSCFNSIGPSKYRASVDKGKQQVCYNINKKDKYFNKFLWVRKQSACDTIIFEIENIIEEINNSDINYYKVTNKLTEFNRNGRSNDDGRATKKTVQQLSTAKNQDFLPNNAVEKRGYLKPYTTTRIKSRNFLSNIAYNSVNDQDIFDRNFYFNTFVLATKNFNPFSLGRKINDQSKYKAIYMLWKDCMPNEFYKFTCKQKNFSYLKGKNVLHLKIADIAWKFICEGETNY